VMLCDELPVHTLYLLLKRLLNRTSMQQLSVVTV
jgi:hypothetical protein